MRVLTVFLSPDSVGHPAQARSLPVALIARHLPIACQKALSLSLTKSLN